MDEPGAMGDEDGGDDGGSGDDNDDIPFSVGLWWLFFKSFGVFLDLVNMTPSDD